MLDIPPDTFDRAYNNVANSILWFVHHLLFDTPNQPRFGREFRRDWAAYQAYNEAFAAAMADEAAAGSAPSAGVRALIQDYHLSLAPRTAAGQAGRRPGRPRHRALLAHALGAARLLPDAARRGRRGGARRHARRGPRRLSRRPVGRRVPGLLRRDPGRAGEPGRRRLGRAGGAPRARQRGGRAPAGRGRPRAAGPGRGGRRAGARRRACRRGGRPEADRQGRPDRAVQEHRARPGRLPRTARHPARVARPGGPPGLRLPVPVDGARVPRLHRAGHGRSRRRSPRSSARRTGIRWSWR